MAVWVCLIWAHCTMIDWEVGVWLHARATATDELQGGAATAGRVQWVVAAGRRQFRHMWQARQLEAYGGDVSYQTYIQCTPRLFPSFRRPVSSDQVQARTSALAASPAVVPSLTTTDASAATEISDREIASIFEEGYALPDGTEPRSPETRSPETPEM